MEQWGDPWQILRDLATSALEVGFDPDREIQHGRGRAEAVDDRLDAVLEVRAGAVAQLELPVPGTSALTRNDRPDSAPLESTPLTA